MPSAQPHVDSWYAATANRQLRCPPLAGHARADICIVGGGYTGLSSAIHLRRQGYSVILLEANRLGWGASGRNGGHVGTGQCAGQQELEALVGTERARALWDLSLEGVQTVCDLVDAFSIDCELKRGDLHVASSRGDARRLAAKVEHLQTVYGYDPVSYIESDSLTDLISGQGFHGAALDSGARHLHPLNYALVWPQRRSNWARRCTRRAGLLTIPRTRR